MTRSDELLAAAAETGDNAAAARLMSEAQAQRGIEAAADVARALEVLESATGQLGPGSLRPFAERTGKIHARAMARLRQAERSAVRAAVRTSGGSGAR